MNNSTLKNVNKTSKSWQFKEGNSGGPGRPKGQKNYLTLLEEAIKNYETKNDINYTIIRKSKAKAGEEPFLKFLKSVQQADVVGEELFPYFNNAIKKPEQGKDC